MMMLANNRNRSNRDGNRESRMNYEMEGNYDPRSGYDVDSRFRDRQGRERYNDGRYAPMRSEMQSNRWLPPYYDVDINRYEYELEKPETNYRNDMQGGRGRENGTRGGREARNEMNMGGYSDADMRRGGGEMRMIGFERDPEMRMASDASVPRYQEMDRMPGTKAMHGGAMSHGSPQFDEHMAREWTAMMENEDGTKGPHWTMEQAKKVLEQRGIQHDPHEFWAVLNAIYSDDVAVAKKHGVNKMDYYVDRAVAWLEDKDAVKDKAAAYYEYVVKK